MKYLLIASVLLVSACGPQYKPQDPRTISGVDPTLAPYIAMYVAEKGHGLSYNIPIQFTELSGNTVGVCTRWSNGYRQIQVDRSYWNSWWTTEDERISLIFHELGHCDLNRDHSSDPDSIMYPYNLGSNNFDELFNHSSSTSLTSLASHAGCVHDIEVDEQ